MSCFGTFNIAWFNTDFHREYFPVGLLDYLDTSFFFCQGVGQNLLSTKHR